MGYCAINQAIGGYFSLELPYREEYHKDALKLNIGRNCLEYILRKRQYHKVYLPYYTCDSVLQPFRKLHIEYEFYKLDSIFEIITEIRLGKQEGILYTNYWGLNDYLVKRYADLYGNRLIIDNTQAFYAKPIQGIDTFYSCRKFFGVADGAYLYTDAETDTNLPTDESYTRMTHLLKRIDLSPEAGYVDFHQTDTSFDNQEIKKMSRLTERIMQSIDYGRIAQKRRENFAYLHTYLKGTNELALTMDRDAVPMVYPYLTGNAKLRNKLINNKIYVAKYWSNVAEWCAKDCTEYMLAEKLIPLPIDQRYSTEDMERIVKIISNL